MSDQRPYRGITKKGKLVKGWYVKSGMDIHYIYIGERGNPIWDIDGCFIEVIPETVSQSTGKIDIAKTEVYVGDKITGDVECGVGHYESFMGEVYWDEKSTFYRVNKVRRVPIYQVKNIEVIGSIHDHLLKGES